MIMASDFQRRQLSGGFLGGIIRLNDRCVSFMHEAIEQVSQELQERLGLIEPVEGIRLGVGEWVLHGITITSLNM